MKLFLALALILSSSFAHAHDESINDPRFTTSSASAAFTASRAPSYTELKGEWLYLGKASFVASLPGHEARGEYSDAGILVEGLTQGTKYKRLDAYKVVLNAFGTPVMTYQKKYVEVRSGQLAEPAKSYEVSQSILGASISFGNSASGCETRSICKVTPQGLLLCRTDSSFNNYYTCTPELRTYSYEVFRKTTVARK